MRGAGGREVPLPRLLVWLRRRVLLLMLVLLAVLVRGLLLPGRQERRLLQLLLLSRREAEQRLRGREPWQGLQLRLGRFWLLHLCRVLALPEGRLLLLLLSVPVKLRMLCRL